MKVETSPPSIHSTSIQQQQQLIRFQTKSRCCYKVAAAHQARDMNAVSGLYQPQQTSHHNSSSSTTSSTTSYQSPEAGLGVSNLLAVGVTSLTPSSGANGNGAGAYGNGGSVDLDANQPHYHSYHPHQTGGGNGGGHHQSAGATNQHLNQQSHQHHHNTQSHHHHSNSGGHHHHHHHNHHQQQQQHQQQQHQYNGHHTIDSTTLGSSHGQSKKSLDKGSDEYKKRRERNNVAVRKSREKAKMRSRETERRVAELSKENQLYRAQYEELRREFNVLKSLLLKTGLTEQVIEDEAQRHSRIVDHNHHMVVSQNQTNNHAHYTGTTIEAVDQWTEGINAYVEDWTS